MGGWAKAVFIILCFGALLALIDTSESFENCIRDRKNHQHYHALHEEGPLLVKTIIRLELHAACGRLTAGENDGAITAIATAIVAFFTFTLWRSTTGMLRITEGQRADLERSLGAAEKSAHAADMSAKAAIGVELPKLLLSRLDFGEMGVASIRARLQYPSVEVEVRNYGRTPAFVLDRSVEVECLDIVYPPLRYRQGYDTPPGTVVESRKVYKLGPARPMRIFTDDEVDEFVRLTKRLAVYGYVTYQDFLGKKHIARFYKEIFVRGEKYSWTEGNPPQEYTESF